MQLYQILLPCFSLKSSDHFPPDIKVAWRPSVIHPFLPPSIHLKCSGGDEDGSLFHRQDVTGKTHESSAPRKTSNINDALFSTVLVLPLLDGIPKYYLYGHFNISIISKIDGQPALTVTVFIFQIRENLEGLQSKSSLFLGHSDNAAQE